ncbi:hypothetical protein VTO42DRAFT_7721 [Malbranchea cinnamomea]
MIFSYRSKNREDLAMEVSLKWIRAHLANNCVDNRTPDDYIWEATCNSAKFREVQCPDAYARLSDRMTLKKLELPNWPVTVTQWESMLPAGA